MVKRKKYKVNSPSADSVDLSPVRYTSLMGADLFGDPDLSDIAPFSSPLAVTPEEQRMALENLDRAIMEDRVAGRERRARTRRSLLDDFDQDDSPSASAASAALGSPIERRQNDMDALQLMGGGDLFDDVPPHDVIAPAILVLDDDDSSDETSGSTDESSEESHGSINIMIQPEIIQLFNEIERQIHDDGWGINQETGQLGWIAKNLLIGAHTNADPGSESGARFAQIVDALYGEQDGAWRDVLTSRVQFTPLQRDDILTRITQPEQAVVPQEDVAANTQRLLEQMAQQVDKDDPADKLEAIEELCQVCLTNPININMVHKKSNGDAIMQHHYLCSECFPRAVGIDGNCPLDRQIVTSTVNTNISELKLELYDMIRDASSKDLQAMLDMMEISLQTNSLNIVSTDHFSTLLVSIFDKLVLDKDAQVFNGVGETRDPIQEILFVVQKALDNREDGGIDPETNKKYELKTPHVHSFASRSKRSRKVKRMPHHGNKKSRKVKRSGHKKSRKVKRSGHKRSPARKRSKSRRKIHQNSKKH